MLVALWWKGELLKSEASRSQESGYMTDPIFINRLQINRSL